MPNLIDLSFFVGEINISNTNTAPVSSSLNNFIASCQQEILEKILGYSLYKDFIYQITPRVIGGNQDNLIYSTPSQRMIDLRDGVEYTDCYGVTQKWKGIVHDAKISLISYYTYYQYQSNQSPVVAEGGTALVKKQPLSYVTPSDKMLIAWNKMSEEIIQCLLFLWSNKITYPEFTSLQYIKAKNSFRKNSDFGF